MPPESIDSSIGLESMARSSARPLVPPSAVCSVIFEVLAPSTSAWLPMKTFRLPSSDATVETCTCAPISRTIWSRWSSRSLGAWPLPCERAICSLSAATRPARLLIALTESARPELTPRCRSSSWVWAWVKRAAISSARDSTTLRAVMSLGVVATSEKALSMSLMAAPMPLVPLGNTSSSAASRSARVESMAATDCDCTAWRVRNWLCERVMSATSTPLPM